MSLFPAYAEQAKIIEENKTNEEETWLKNPSFKADINVINQNVAGGEQYEILSECSSSGDKETTKRKKHKTKHRKRKHDKISPDKIEDYKDFEIDKTRIKEYLTVNTIARPSAPKYRVKYYVNCHRKSKKSKFKRYFKLVLDKKKSEDEAILTKANLHKANFNERDEHFTGFNQEEDLTKTTEFYNKTLADCPNDVKMWLKYIQFQDVVYQFEKTYRKGSIAKAQRVLAERKISILDKAISLNPSCEQLLRERLKIAVSTFPADELQIQLKKLVENEQGNIILWQGYIEATQCSMSHCNTPAVISLYTKCLSTLHQLRRTSTLEKYLLEENILRMLYQCGLFLKQAGLFEQLWTLLRMYLELNLSPADKTRFNISSGFNEKQLVELEEVVFNSHLPLHELWLRTEKLRESCHWMPYLEDQECEDPQRIVFTEDVAELIHPIAMPENIFKFVATVLSLLKIPLLPCRHNTLQDLGLDYVPWSLDSVETLLPVFFPLFPIDVTNKILLNDTNRLAVGPQYLKILPGQEEYLEFILTIMQNCADCLKDDDQIAVRIWWFRFQRLLVILDKENRFKMPQYLKKKIKSNIKNLLKRDEHRNNEIFYLEYALIENELGNYENCIKILETAVSMNENTVLVAKNWQKPQANQCYLYRTLVEVTLKSQANVEMELNKQNVLKYLVTFVLQRKFDNLTQGLLMEADTKLRLLTIQLLQSKIYRLPARLHFLPDFFSDWLICYGWFLYLYKSPIESGAFLEKTLETLETSNPGPIWQKEVLYEFYVAVMFKYCTETPGCGVFKLLDNILHRAIEVYPNNLFFMSVLAKEQSLVFSMGQQWWKIEKLLLNSGRAISAIFAVIISSQRKISLDESFKDTVTGEKYGTDTNFRNRMLSLFKRLTKGDMCTRSCGLVWRLYLQFVQEYFDLNLCRNTYYSAVEECPWLKALYIDAAIYIPAELSQIQDLIIEKQLRLHVTPEELDILRS